MLNIQYILCNKSPMFSAVSFFTWTIGRAGEVQPLNCIVMDNIASHYTRYSKWSAGSVFYFLVPETLSVNSA